MDFYNLIGKKINNEFNGDVFNSFTIREIIPTSEFMEGRGRMYDCPVSWEKIMEGSYPVLKFEEQTLKDLLTKGVAVCPFLPQLKYVIEK